jgi:hypothetical protein
MAQASTSARAPRGTKVLTKAFFAAADHLPAGSRDVAIKAAIVAIRDGIKASRTKVAARKIVKPTAKSTAPLKAGVVRKRLGRPFGSKNKPKVVEAPVVSEEVVVKAAKKTARKAQAPKQDHVELMAAE